MTATHSNKGLTKGFPKYGETMEPMRDATNVSAKPKLLTSVGYSSTEYTWLIGRVTATIVLDTRDNTVTAVRYSTHKNSDNSKFSKCLTLLRQRFFATFAGNGGGGEMAHKHISSSKAHIIKIPTATLCIRGQAFK